MPLLKKKNKENKEETIFIGTNVSKEVASYLNLYCVSEGTGKSQVVRTLINNWFNDMQEDVLKESLYKQIITDSIKVRKNKDNSRKRINTFLGELRVELTKKGIKRKICDKIIKGVENEEKKAKGTS